MARDKGKGWRLDLGDELEARLSDFAAAYYDANKTRIVREAVDWYIKLILEKEPERKKRYEQKRAQREGSAGDLPKN
jgi:hypothetical protein